MTLTRKTTNESAYGVTVPDRHPLPKLVRRIARHDRKALAALHELLVAGIRSQVRQVLPEPTATAVTAAVFEEVWMLAGAHLADRPADWIGGIATRRTAERLRGLAAAVGTLAFVGAVSDERATAALTDLLAE